MAGDWTRGRRPWERRPAVYEGWAGRLGKGTDLVAGDGFLLQQGGGEPVEGVPVARA